MRLSRKLLILVAGIMCVLFLVTDTAHSGSGKKVGHKGSEAMSPGYMNAEMQRAKRWSHNPRDARGQGNMGKVLMRDPYGFDKDSDREKADRSRRIREDLGHGSFLNLAGMTTVDFTITDTLLSGYLIS